MSMSIHLHIDKRKKKSTPAPMFEDDDSCAYGSASDASSDDDDDQNFYNWNDSPVSGPESRIQSLFEQARTFGNVKGLKYDRSEIYGVDLDDLCAALKGNGTVDALTGRKEAYTRFHEELDWKREIFRSDEYSVPVIRNNALLLHESDLDDGYTTSVSTSTTATRPTHLDPHSAGTHIKSVKQNSLKSKKTLMNTKEWFERGSTSGKRSKKDQGKDAIEKKQREKRDGYSHYFESYGHSVMFQDNAKSIYTNPELFDGATIVDVGCGTGILSLFTVRGLITRR
ncbi:hypothetical protein K435DRAFT_917743 [Dendrothele bispora CBS 962.96]|uniref:Methyltransferase domain-containing protein n=1 Tax=Dendrothele bispora (strain CBS 962.96) TaxID=1314807 RepID=A0A4S8LGT4_DENBC|nr:hypothetical protein K435DRAFT_917743 [Dendrothele bispora CBS 962.96]